MRLFVGLLLLASRFVLSLASLAIPAVVSRREAAARKVRNIFVC